MQSPSKKKKGIWYIKLYILLYETIYQRRQLLGRAKRYAPSLQISFLVHTTNLVSSSLPHAYAVQVGNWWPQKTYPPQERQARLNVIKISHKPQLSASQLKVALVGSQKRLWSLQWAPERGIKEQPTWKEAVVSTNCG